MVGRLDQVVRRGLGDPDHDHDLALAPEKAHERDKVSVPRYQHVGVHLRVVVQEIRALDREHDVDGVGTSLGGLAAGEVAG